MDKLTAIKIKYNDGTYSDEIPISALAENVEWDNSYSLVDILGEVAYDTKGSIQDQISQLFNEKVSETEMINYVSTNMNTYITNWLNDNVDPIGSAVIVDESFSISGAAADSKKVGDTFKNAVKPFESNISSNFINNNPSFVSLRNWESGYIYNVSSSAASVIIDLPNNLSGNFTITKLNGSGRGKGGWSEYLITTGRSGRGVLFFGFDTGSNISWNELDIDNLIKTEPTVITEQWYSNNNDKTILNMPLNRIYRGSLPTNYKAFGIPDGNSFTLISFSPYGSASATTNPERGYAVYFYYSFLNTNIKDSYYCFKSVNDNLNDNSFRWFRINNGHKKYLFIGDSYAEGYSHDGNNNGWCRYCVSYMGLTQREYQINYSGGSSFAGTNKFVDLLGDFAPYDFTDIVVCGGFNDKSYTEAEILTAIENFVNTAKIKYPNVKIHIGFIAYIKQGSGTGAITNWQTIKDNLINITLPAYQKCITKKASYLNNVEYWLNEEGLTNSDGYHPSALGNQRIGMAIANALLTGSAPLPYNNLLRLN